MTPFRVHTISLGCPKNRVDTEYLLGGLGPGVAPVEDPAGADLVLVNTCSFIAPAIEESLETILQIVADLEDEEDRPVLAVAGCLVSRFGAEELAAEVPEVDVWLSTRELDRWAERVGPLLAARAPDRVMESAPLRALSTGPSFAYLKVAEGCSRKCRFCTIPSIRGPLRSNTLEALEAEARFLLDQGVGELVLVAQDLTAYGRDLGLDNGLARLLERLLPLGGLQWLRPMYLYPSGLTDEVLDLFAGQTGPLLPYFDIPLQHAHPDILRSMGRAFSADPLSVVERIRDRVPGAVFRTSLIVGYPGETEAEFAALERFVDEARLDHVGVFAFQPEEGTPAAAIKNQVKETVSQARRERIMELQAGFSRERMEARVGETLMVLVDREHGEWPGLFQGRAWFQAPEVDGVVYVSGEGFGPGDFVDAEIVDATDYDLSGLA